MAVEDMHGLVLVYAAFLIAAASPGPSTMAIMGVAMSQGRAAAVALALGVVTGSMTWAALAATGMAALLSGYAHAIWLLKCLGGLYLMFLAFKSARSALSSGQHGRARLVPRPVAALYRRGVLLHLTNPKAILGWVALMSLGMGPEASPHRLQAIIVGCALLGLLVNVGYAMMFSMPLMGRAYERSRRGIEAVLAAMFGYAGLRLLLSRA